MAIQNNGTGPVQDFPANTSAANRLQQTAWLVRPIIDGILMKLVNEQKEMAKLQYTQNKDVLMRAKELSVSANETYFGNNPQDHALYGLMQVCYGVNDLATATELGRKLSQNPNYVGPLREEFPDLNI